MSARPRAMMPTAPMTRNASPPKAVANARYATAAPMAIPEPIHLNAGRSAISPAAYRPSPIEKGIEVHRYDHSDHRSFMLVYSRVPPTPARNAPGITMPARRRGSCRPMSDGTRKKSESATSSTGHQASSSRLIPSPEIQPPIAWLASTSTPIASSIRPSDSSTVRLMAASIVPPMADPERAPIARAARQVSSASLWLMVVGPSILLIYAWVEVLNNPGLSLVDGRARRAPVPAIHRTRPGHPRLFAPRNRSAAGPHACSPARGAVAHPARPPSPGSGHAPGSTGPRNGALAAAPARGARGRREALTRGAATSPLQTVAGACAVAGRGDSRAGNRPA